jgi:hypothetical protein
MRMIVTPDQVSPCRIEYWIGETPRQRGSRLACTLMQPYFGVDSSGSRRMCPNAATITASGSQASTSAQTAACSPRPNSRTGR